MTEASSRDLVTPGPVEPAATLSFVVRPAEQGDVPGMAALIAALAERDELLPRSADAIAATLGYWVVAVVTSESTVAATGRGMATGGAAEGEVAAAAAALAEVATATVPVAGAVVACGSLLDYHDGLTEVRSLAVDPAFQGQGLGRAVVAALVATAKARRIGTVFALTRAVPFFERQGFAVTAKERFPEKVWRDCLACPLVDRCDEVAVVFTGEKQSTWSEPRARNGDHAE